MSAPFIVRSVSRIHPGKADAYRPVAAEFCGLVETPDALGGFTRLRATAAG